MFRYVPNSRLSLSPPTSFSLTIPKEKKKLQDTHIQPGLRRDHAAIRAKIHSAFSLSALRQNHALPLSSGKFQTSVGRLCRTCSLARPGFVPSVVSSVRTFGPDESFLLPLPSFSFRREKVLCLVEEDSGHSASGASFAADRKKDHLSTRACVFVRVFVQFLSFFFVLKWVKRI